MSKPKSKNREQLRKLYKSGRSSNWDKGKGYSLSCNIPKSFCELLSLTQDTIMVCKVRGDRIILEALNQ